MLPVASSTALKPARIIGWSSAITTRSLLMLWLVAVGQQPAHLEPADAARPGGQRAAEQGGALAHADEAVAARRRRRERPRSVRRVAAVDDGELEPVGAGSRA